MMIFIASDNIEDVVEFNSILNSYNRLVIIDRENSLAGVQCLNHTRDKLLEQTEG